MANNTHMQGVGGPFVPLAGLLVEAIDGALDGLRTMTFNPFPALIRAQKRFEQRQRLKDMDDRLLEDMGLTREMVDRYFD